MTNPMPSLVGRYYFLNNFDYYVKKLTEGISRLAFIDASLSPNLGHLFQQHVEHDHL